MPRRLQMTCVLTGCLLGASTFPAFAEDPSARGDRVPPPAAAGVEASWDYPASPPAAAPGAPSPGHSDFCSTGSNCAAAPTVCEPEDVFYGGIDYLLIRPHFSQAIAFAEGRQTADGIALEAHELEFNYESSIRLFVGTRIGGSNDRLQFTYWRLRGERDVDGAVAGPGEFLVDPFGNLVGGVAIVDPQSNLFGQVLTGGDFISTRASVDVNIYDLDYIHPLAINNPCCEMLFSVGGRIADVEQFYASTVTAGGAVLSHGDYNVDFVGAGPRLGMEVRRWLGDYGFSVFANTHGSLLVGNYDASFSNFVTAPTAFRASQEESLTRIVPVAEAELGGTWQLTETVAVTGGWLFQGWFDLGTSGGRFAGLYTGVDDTNLMSFDGLFLRTEMEF